MTGPEARNSDIFEEASASPRRAVRRPPPMRVVTKGWWRIKEEEVDMETLKREDRNGYK